MNAQTSHKIHIALLSAMIILCSLNSLQAQELKTIQLNGLEIDVPADYDGYSHMINGALQTSLRKGGGSLTSMLIVSVAKVGIHFDIEDMWEAEPTLKTVIEQMGYIREKPFAEFKTDVLYGLKTEAKGTMQNQPFDVVIKFVSFGDYYIQFMEYYGEDFSDEYYAIEESLRLSDKKATTGTQTIAEGGYSFIYNANRVMAMSNSINGVPKFTFTYTASTTGDNFLEYNFPTIDMGNFEARDTKERQQKFKDYSAEWFDKIENALREYFTRKEFGDMEPVEFLGQPGYMKKGIAIQKHTGEEVLFTIQVCLHSGKFVWSFRQQSLDITKQPLEEIEALFQAIESSFRYTPE